VVNRLYRNLSGNECNQNNPLILNQVCRTTIMTNLPDEKILNELLEMGQQMYDAAQKMSETSEAMAQKIQKQIEDAKAAQAVK
jgi:hypothetical protein